MTTAKREKIEAILSPAIDCRAERLRAALKPFADAITEAEKSAPSDVDVRLELCHQAVTLYEFGNARHVHEQLLPAKED